MTLEVPLMIQSKKEGKLSLPLVNQELRKCGNASLPELLRPS
jgi:hypothetical protein